MTTNKSSPSGPVVGLTGTVTFDAVDCLAASITPQTVPIPGVAAGDPVFLAPPPAGLDVAVAIFGGYGSAPNVATVPFFNPTAGPLNPGSATYRYYVVK